MGAEYCSDVIPDPELEKTNVEIKMAFNTLVKEDEYNYGHSGYTGSFAEKEAVNVHRDRIFETTKEAEKFVRDDLDSCKWGPADAVPVKGVGWYVGGWCSC